MDADTRFEALIRRCRSGSAAAIRELLDAYGPYVLRVVRRRLSPQLRRVFDSQDFFQDVWHSFFQRFPHRLNFSSPKALQVFLGKMANNKVVDACRRGLRHSDQSSSADSAIRQPANNTALSQEPVSRDRTASEAAMSKEAQERLADLPICLRTPI
jgi:DNA-directed RNA polymerase specialized sigma24 family protein